MNAEYNVLIWEIEVHLWKTGPMSSQRRPDHLNQGCARAEYQEREQRDTIFRA